MNTHLNKVLLLVIFSVGFSCGDDPEPIFGWKQKVDFMGEGRQDMVSFVANGKAYAGMGLGEADALYDLWEYTPESDSWIRKKDVPVQQNGEIAFSVGDKAYVLFFGRSGFYEYDPSTDSWAQRAPFPQYRTGRSGFVVHGRLFAGMGCEPTSPGNCSNDWWEYEIGANKWTKRASLPTPPRSQSRGWGTPDRGYLGFGADQNGLLHDFWEYDPLLNKWAKLNAPTDDNIPIASFTLDNQAYLVFQYLENGKWGGILYRYSSSRNEWFKQPGFLPESNYYPGTFVIGKTAYLVSGTMATADVVKQVWAYGPR